MDQSALKSFQLLPHTPKPVRGVTTPGSFGLWVIPFPPEGACRTQLMDFAAVVSFSVSTLPMKETMVGIVQQVDRVMGAYLGRWYDNPKEYFKPFDFGE